MSNVLRTAPDVTTSPVFRIRGQRSRWRYPDPRLTPEHCEILRDVNLSRQGSADTRYGYTLYNSTQVPGGEIPVGLWQGTFSDGTVRQVFVTPTAVYSDDGSTRTNITGSALTGSAEDRVQFLFLKDKLLANNTVDAPRSWDGSLSSNSAAISGIPFSKCKALILHQNLLLAFGTTESGTYYPTRVRWCDINKQTLVVDINTWRDVNRYEIYDGGAPIVGAVDAWGQALVFKSDGVYPGGIVYGNVGNLDYQLGKPLRGFSPIGGLGLVARPEFVFGVAREGLFVIRPDLSFELINEDDATEWFGLNQNRLQYVQTHVRERDHQIRLLCSSSTNSSYHDRVLVWDWDSGDVWLDRPTVKRNYQASLISSNEELDWSAGGDGYLYKGNKSTYTDDAGTAIPWQIKMVPNDLGLQNKNKKVLNLNIWYRKVSGAQSASYTVRIDEGRQSSVTGTITVGTGQTWNTGLRWNNGLRWSGRVARRASIEINRVCETVTLELTGTNPLGIDGYTVEYVPLEN